MSKFELKIVSALLFAAVTPLVFAAVLADRMVADAFQIGMDPRLTEHLRLGSEVYREFIASRKAAHRAQLELFAGSPALAEALEARDIPVLEGQLRAFLERAPHATAVRAFDPESQELAAVAAPPAPDAEPVRTLEIAQPVSPSGAARPVGEVRATYALAEHYILEQQALEEELQTTHNLAQALEPIQRIFIWTYVIIVGVVILATAGIGIFLSRRVTRRINAVVRATRRVGTGDLDFALEIAAQDEIGDLTSEFNRMVAELRESRSRIQYLERISAWQEMARRLAHEIKNPLTPIQLAVQEITSKYSGDDARYQDLLATAQEVVSEEVGVLRALVKEFSDFARLPAVKPQPTDLAAFVEEVVKAHSFDEGIAITVQAPASLPPVAIDRVMLRTALDNLILNAVQAGAEPAEVTVTLRSEPGRVFLEIADRGPGVPADLKVRLFDPYFTTKREGTGLGLAITKKVILDHNGAIEVLDNPGGGALFRIRLPRHEG